MDAIAEKWQALQDAGQALGDALTEPQPTPDDQGSWGSFANGDIYCRTDQAAYEVHGLILAKYQELGGVTSPLGFPTSDETVAADGQGRFNTFEGGAIYWHPDTGAWEVHGNIYATYLTHGAEASTIGYPQSDGYEDADNRQRNDFQFGTITWAAEEGARYWANGIEEPGPVANEHTPAPLPAPDPAPDPTPAPPPAPARATTMRQSVADRLAAFQKSFEGEVAYLYLDSKGLVSVGIGQLLDDEAGVKDGAGMAARLGFVHLDSGQRATEQEIRAEWAMVKQSGTAGKWQLLEASTKLRLPASDIRQLLLDTANNIIKFLKNAGHQWDTYPADAQLGLLSLGWVGLGHYPKCLQYVKAGNWFYAAGEATLPEVPARQTQQQSLLRCAGRVVTRGLDPEVLWFDNKTTAGRAFFFQGDRYLSYPMAGGGLDPGRPAPIDTGNDPANDWPGFGAAGFGSDLDAALNMGNGHLFFFKGDRYLAYDSSRNAIVGEPALISDYWPDFATAGFDHNLDAALNLGDGRLLFFKGSQYVAYTSASRQLEGPLPLTSGTGPGLFAALAAGGFDSDLDAALNMGDGRLLFFKQSQYVSYNIHPGTVSADYPRPMWPLLADAGFGIDISAAVDLG